MRLDLTGKTAIVTGGNIGIGKAFSLALAGCGVAVVATHFSSDFVDEWQYREEKGVLYVPKAGKMSYRVKS